MQTQRYSWLEVGVDFVFMLVFNIGGQMLVYGRLATTGRAITFAAASLLLSVSRRYLLRRWFNALLRIGEGQSRTFSLLEALTDTLLALGMSIVLQWLWYGPAATWAAVTGLTLGIYVLTLGRRYLLRRIFEYVAQPQSVPLLTRVRQGIRQAIG